MAEHSILISRGTLIVYPRKKKQINSKLYSAHEREQNAIHIMQIFAFLPILIIVIKNY